MSTKSAATTLTAVARTSRRTDALPAKSSTGVVRQRPTADLAVAEDERSSRKRPAEDVVPEEPARKEPRAAATRTRAPAAAKVKAVTIREPSPEPEPEPMHDADTDIDAETETKKAAAPRKKRAEKKTLAQQLEEFKVDTEPLPVDYTADDALHRLKSVSETLLICMQAQVEAIKTYEKQRAKELKSRGRSRNTDPNKPRRAASGVMAPSQVPESILDFIGKDVDPTPKDILEVLKYNNPRLYRWLNRNDSRCWRLQFPEAETNDEDDANVDPSTVSWIQCDRLEVARPQVTREIYAYITANNLKDPANPKIIKPDEYLEELLGDPSFDLVKKKVKKGKKGEEDQETEAPDAEPPAKGYSTGNIQSYLKRIYDQAFPKQSMIEADD